MPSMSAKQHRAKGKNRLGKITKVPDALGLAWAAGIICGEGSITTHRPKGRIGVRITVGQSTTNAYCPEMLVRLQHIFGVGSSCRMNYRRLDHHRFIWQYSVRNHADVQALIALMWRWLTVEKQDQAVKAFREYHRERNHAVI